MDAYEKLLHVFSRREKPEHFTNYRHCEDCKEFDDVLRYFKRDDISFSELGNIAWNPISSVNIEGFLYYLPALARLALGKGDSYFVDQFLIHVDKQDRLGNMNQEEKSVFRDYLIWLSEEMESEIKENLDDEDLRELINRLK